MQLTNISYGDEQFNSGFRVFVDMNQQRFRSAFTTTHVVKLTSPLYLGNGNIYVSDGSVLGTPDAGLLIPGIVNINGERIIYYEKDGNRLSRLRRGAGGTGAPAVHLAGSDVEDVGPNRYNNEFAVYAPGPIYNVYPTASSVNEGNSIRFQIDTVNIEPGTTLYWSNDGTAQIVDFLGGGSGFTNKGSVVLTGEYTAGTASVILTPIMDQSTEGSETIVFNLRTQSVNGDIVATAETVTINDISIVPEYTINPRSVTVTEGSSVFYDVVTRGLAGGTTLYWTNSGSTQPTDFLVQSNSGTVVIGGDYASGFGTIKLDTVRSPGATPTKSIVLNLRTGSVSGSIVKTANVVYVTDTPDPAYSVSATILSYDSTVTQGQTRAVNENDSIQFDFFTSGIEGNTTLFYNLTGTSTGSDYNSLLNWGSVKTVGTEFGACANVIITLVEDLATEGVETLIFNAYATRTFDQSSFIGGPITFNITDTSVAASVTCTPSSSSVSEGDSVTITLSTDGIAPGSVVYWKNLGTTTSNDFDSYPASTILITGAYRAGTGSITFQLAQDLTPNQEITPGANEEGPETIVFAVYLTNPDAGGTPPAPATAPITITVGDTSKVTTTSTTTLSPLATPPAGAALVNFYNGDFEVPMSITTDPVTGVISIPGWSIYTPGSGITPGHLRLNGFSQILGWPTPNDPSPHYAQTPKPYCDQDPPVSMNFGFQIDNGTAGDFGGSKIIRLYSSGTSVSFGVVRGPYLVADNPIICVPGDKVFFHWKAEAGGDDFDVFAYLLDTSNGKTIILLDSSSPQFGSTTTPWVRVEREIASNEAGTYRFVFICGSYDASGGTALGASLYLDNIDKISGAAPASQWSITVDPPVQKQGGSLFVFNWTAPAYELFSNKSWWIVSPGTQTILNSVAEITGSTFNLSINATSGAIVVETNEVVGQPVAFQLLITHSNINSAPIVRSPVCTITM